MREVGGVLSRVCALELVVEDVRLRGGIAIYPSFFSPQWGNLTRIRLPALDI